MRWSADAPLRHHQIRRSRVLQNFSNRSFSSIISKRRFWQLSELPPKGRTGAEEFGVEGLQVVRLLAKTDEFDRQTEYLLDGHHHAALARTVSADDGHLWLNG